MIHYSPAAESDLEEIWLSVAPENLRAADRLIDALKARIEPLAVSPELGPSRPEIATDVRVMTEGNYLVLYRVTGDHIEIVRVVHGARDLRGLFDSGFAG